MHILAHRSDTDLTDCSFNRSRIYIVCNSVGSITMVQSLKSFSNDYNKFVEYRPTSIRQTCLSLKNTTCVEVTEEYADPAYCMFTMKSNALLHLTSKWSPIIEPKQVFILLMF